MLAPYGSAADTPLDRRARWVSPSFALHVGARILGIRVSSGGRHTSAGRQHDRPRLEPWRCAPLRAQENCFRLTRRRPTGPRRAICAGAADPRRPTRGGRKSPMGSKAHHADPAWHPVRASRPRGPAEPAKRFGTRSNRRLRGTDPSTPAVATLCKGTTPPLTAHPDRPPPGWAGFAAHRCRGMTLDHRAASGRTAAMPTLPKRP
jgi:hypothetical protein